MDFITSPVFLPFTQLVLATLFGMILGIERILVGRMAGPRTYGLVSMGACLLTILSTTVPLHYSAAYKADPIPLVSAIVTGIGFLGAGMIIFKNSKLSGLTTAAGIWVSAAIGIAVGMQEFLIAFFVTSLALFLFTVMWKVERQIKEYFSFEIDIDEKE